MLPFRIHAKLISNEYFNALFTIAILLTCGSNLAPQNGNSISGQVFGAQRQPLNDVNIELQDEFSRLVERTRTSGGGRFMFRNLSAGRYRILVQPSMTDFEEQSHEIEIVNFTTQSRTGETRTSGYSNEQKDIYLKPRKPAEQVLNELIFVSIRATPGHTSFL